MRNADGMLLAQGVRSSELKRVGRMRELALSGKARELRERANVTLRETAAAVPTSPSTLSRWETGQSRPRPEPALRWFRFLADLTGERL